MQHSFSRRTATKVVNGRTQAKNRVVPTAHRGYVIDRETPKKGCRHVVSKRDLQDFIDLIPDWTQLSRRLERIVLSDGDSSEDGYHVFYHREETGAIFLNAWEEDLWTPMSMHYYETHRHLLEPFGVSCDVSRDRVLCRFTPAQARAFVLLHVFMHELGHHWDHMHQRHRHSQRGEDFAEAFANRHFQALFPAYIEAFGHPAHDH